jgi:hypothetical protein
MQTCRQTAVLLLICLRPCIATASHRMCHLGETLMYCPPTSGPRPRTDAPDKFPVSISVAASSKVRNARLWSSAGA